MKRPERDRSDGSTAGAAKRVKSTQSADHLDFQFGWRWLLPLERVQGLAALGLNPLEEDFLSRELGLRSWSPTAEARDVLLVVNADAVDATEWVEPPSAQIHAACVFGSNAAVRGWKKLLRRKLPWDRTYGLLPRGQPRLVVPLSAASSARQALRLHLPGRPWARVQVHFARALLGLGIRWPLARSALWIARSEESFTPWGAVEAAVPQRPGREQDFALYLGMPDGGRRTTVLPVPHAGNAVIMKTARTEEGKRRLLEEAAALRNLSHGSLAAYVPRIAELVETSSSLTLHQEYRPRVAASRREMHRAVVHFLGELSLESRDSLPVQGHPLLEETSAGSRVPRLLRSFLPKTHPTAGVWLHRSHGDFTPWNCSWTASGLLVFDWEASKLQDLALSDAFHYVVAPARLLRSDRPPRDVVGAALRFGREVAAHAALPTESVPVQFAFWAAEHARGGSDYHLRLLEALAEEQDS